jgi:large subunit ribosomal protein L22
MEAVAKLRNYPTSPRKMRLIADLIRGMKVDKALAVLEHNPKHSSEPVRKLLLSAISNWKQKNEGGDEAGLYVTTIFVDGARTLKRMRPAPQGRGYKIRKRSNHVTLMVNDQPTAKEIKKTAAKKTYSTKDKSGKENNNSKTLASETK